MEAIRYVEEIESNSITIKNLNRFKGKKVEIIILPYESPAYDYDEEWGTEAENRIEAHNKGYIRAFDGKKVISELKEKYSVK